MKSEGKAALAAARLIVQRLRAAAIAFRIGHGGSSVHMVLLSMQSCRLGNCIGYFVVSAKLDCSSAVVAPMFNTVK